MKQFWLHYKPMTGLLDRLSDPDQIPAGAVRDRVNFSVPANGKLARAPGWRKLHGTDGDDATYNNADLHDQLLKLTHYFGSLDTPSEKDDSVTEPSEFSTYCSGTVQYLTGAVREPIVFQREFVTTSGVRRYVIGTPSRLYAYNESTETYQIIADGMGGAFSLGCKMRRWNAAQVGDVVIFTNDYDPIKHWIIGSGPQGCAMQAVQDIVDADTIRLTQAAVVIAWKGLCFYMNLVMDGRKWENRVLWSDADDALSLDPETVGSIAGSQFLDQGERIINASALGDYLLIYTNRSIWQVSVVAGEEGLNFRQAYVEAKSGEACLVYPNTLVNTGDFHIYMGRDGIYFFNLAMPKPERSEWLHAAAASIYSDISESCCLSHVAEYRPSTKEVWFSWVAATPGAYLPVKTLVSNVQYRAANFIDHGFTCFCNRTQDDRMTLRDFVAQYVFCDITTIPGVVYMKEGMPRQSVSSALFSSAPVAFYTTKTINLEINGETITVEDFSDNNPTGDTLCSRLAGVRLEDLCSQCNEKQLFIGASSTDYCLKEIGEVYYRERCTNAAAGTSHEETAIAGIPWPIYTAFVGTYSRDGYQSTVLSGPIDAGDPTVQKLIIGLEVQFDASVQVDPPELVLDIGASVQAVDPLTHGGRCAIMWQRQTNTRFFLECQSTLTEEGHAAAGSKPANSVYWPLWTSNAYLYWRLTIDKPDGAAAGTLPINGECSFSRVSLKLQR